MHSVLNRHLVFSCEMTCAHTPNTKASSLGVLLLTMVLRFPRISIFSHLVSLWLKRSTEERVCTTTELIQSLLMESHGNELGLKS